MATFREFRPAELQLKGYDKYRGMYTLQRALPDNLVRDLLLQLQQPSDRWIQEPGFVHHPFFYDICPPGGMGKPGTGTAAENGVYEWLRKQAVSNGPFGKVEWHRQYIARFHHIGGTMCEFSQHVDQNIFTDKRKGRVVIAASVTLYEEPDGPVYKLRISDQENGRYREEAVSWKEVELQHNMLSCLLGSYVEHEVRRGDASTSAQFVCNFIGMCMMTELDVKRVCHKPTPLPALYQSLFSGKKCMFCYYCVTINLPYSLFDLLNGCFSGRVVNRFLFKIRRLKRNESLLPKPKP
jgi:hypothetical protein